MTEHDQGVALQDLHRSVLEGVALGQPLKSVMDLICRRVEAIAPGTLCSVLAIDGEGLLQHLASPSLPETYSRAIDGTRIGPCVGSCGTAAYRGEAVEVLDISTDPLWSDYKALALPLGVRACWSSPIKSRDGRVVGTFAFYYRTQRGPSVLERHVVDSCVHLCSIAIEHEEQQARIQHLAFRDALTGLANRASFQRYAEQALAGAQKVSSRLAIHYIDLDDFKGVNDTLGHCIGDRLLERVAKRLASCAREGEIVARVGGDEFAIIQSPVEGRKELSARARLLVALFDEPFEVEHHSICIGASIGIAEAPADGWDVFDLLKKADLALYSAKSEGRGSYQFFTADMCTGLHTRRALEQDLRKAIALRQFELVYQPIVDLSSNEIVGLEALVRWHHPTRGVVPPLKFIPAAEQMGLIERLGEWVLFEACKCARLWPPTLKVAVNLSPRQLAKRGFVLAVARALSSAGLPAHRLELEITESVPLAENGSIRKCLHELKELGVGISLDDFGTGYSSLSYLRAFPFDRIKIDRSFVRDLRERSDARSIVRAVLGLARDLGMRTTAEGIETGEQLAWLRAEGCTDGQGFFFSRPRVAADLSSAFFHGSLVSDDRVSA